jgi:hypothetical protein
VILSDKSARKRRRRGEEDYWHYSLLTTHYSLLTTHYSLLTTHYSLAQDVLMSLSESLSLSGRSCGSSRQPSSGTSTSTSTSTSSSRGPGSGRPGGVSGGVSGSGSVRGSMAGRHSHSHTHRYRLSEGVERSPALSVRVPESTLQRHEAITRVVREQARERVLRSALLAWRTARTLQLFLHVCKRHLPRNCDCNSSRI